MDPEDRLHNEGGGLPALRLLETPGALWAAGWTLLTTAAIPAALVGMAPFAVMLIWLVNLGANAGFWPAARPYPLELPGFLVSFALVLAFSQWILLRRYLPKAWGWLIVTTAGVFLGVLPAWFILDGPVQGWDPLLFLAVVLLPVGLALGLAQWLYLRRYLPGAFRILFIDVLAFGSVLLVGRTITNLFELLVLFLPGAITGLGMLLLLRQAPQGLRSPAIKEAGREKDRRLPTLARVGIGVAALVPLFFLCSWVYAASQLTLAKSEGIYATVEEGVVERNSAGVGDAEVIRIEGVRANVNQYDGSQPHVWFGTATVYLDRVPEGRSWDHYNAGSYYIKVSEGWVHVPEGAFPEFIGWVMAFYNMEGVDR